MRIEGIEALVASLSSLPSGVSSGVKVLGAVNFVKAMVWENGYVTRVIKPGPKTMWSVNWQGDPKVLTITAPTGFIHVNRSTYARILNAEFNNARFQDHAISEWPELVDTMMRNAAHQCAALVSESAPIDTGELRESIVAAEPGDVTLTAVQEFSADAFYDVADLIFGG